MINRYRTVSRQLSAVTMTDIANAKRVSSVASRLEATKQIDAYEFTADDEFTQAVAGCMVHVWSEKADNKVGFVNKAEILLNDHKYFANVYGVKNAPVAEKTYSVEESKKLKFGTCTSGGQEVGTTKLNGRTGELEFIPTTYVNLG